MATIKPNLSPTLTIQTDSLYNPVTGTGAGPIQFDSSDLPTDISLKNDIIDYIRLRLGDGIIDIEADKEHFDISISLL